MSPSRLVPAFACAVIALCAVFVTFVVLAGHNQPQPGSEPPVGYVPPPEFLEQVRREREAWEAKLAAEQEASNKAGEPPLETDAPPPAPPAAETTDDDAS